MKFSDAFRAIARNKYFWIISLAGWLGFLEGSFNSILGWMYNYQHACTAGQYSLVIAIAGNASFWPNLVAPFFIRKYGKKKILIFTNILNIFFITFMLPIVRMTGSSYIIWLLLACTFVNQFITSLGHLLGPSVNADIRDYQQYITGDRIDGMFSAVGLIGNVITMTTGFVLPMIYARSGLNKQTAVSLGYSASNVYDVLYNQNYFVKISSVLIVASVFGAVMNVIPFFFYNLTETKQKAMVQVLKIRAFFEDYGNNVLTDKSKAEMSKIISTAKNFEGKDTIQIVKGMSREQKKEAKAHNESVEISRLVIQELNRFNTPFGKNQIENAQKIFDAGLNGYLTAYTVTKSEILSMPKATDIEKQERRSALIQYSNIKAAKRAIVKYFPDGIKEFDTSVFETLFARQDELELELNECLKALKAAKEERNSQSIAMLKVRIKDIGAQKEDNKKKLKKATDENSIYYRASKPYQDAHKLLLQSKNYSHIDEIISEI